MIRKMLLLVLLAAAAAGASEAPDPAPEEALVRMMRESEAAWNAGNIPGFMASYWQSPDLRFASGGSVTRGWQETLDRYLARYPDPGAMGRLVFADIDVQMLGPDHALVFGSWRLVRTGDTPHGLFSLICRRLPEGWRVVHDHTSSATE